MSVTRNPYKFGDCVKVHYAWGFNYGDGANYDLVKWLSGKEPVLTSEVDTFFSRKDAWKTRWWIESCKEILRLKRGPCYLVMGSILSFPRFRTIVWGSGVIAPENKLQAEPYQIAAVRGPLTKHWLASQGVYAPAVYGDPGVFLPLVFGSPPAQKWELGIALHYQHKSALEGLEIPPWVKVIQMTGKRHKDIAHEIAACKCVASSSLHGLITADAYGIPAAKIEFRAKLLGDHFKFEDYERTLMGPERSWNDLRSDRIDFDALAGSCVARSSSHLRTPLLEACPFAYGTVSV